MIEHGNIYLQRTYHFETGHRWNRQEGYRVSNRGGL